MKALLITISVIVAIIPLALAIYYFLKAREKVGWFYYENKHEQRGFMKENATAKEHETVMIGDSIIDLYKVEKYFPDKVIYNRGISGDYTTNVIKRIASNALSIHPQNLILLIGTNDITNGIDTNATITNMQIILEIVKAANVPNIYVESIYPVNAHVNKEMVDIRDNDYIIDMNEKLMALCDKEGVKYINIHDELVDDEGNFMRDCTVDGLHPNHNGYEIVTRVLKENVDALK